MRFKKSLFVIAVILAGATAVPAQDKSLGTIKGKVRVETGTPAGVMVVVRRGETEVTRSTTNKDGDFVVSKLTPGTYGLTFRKPGLSIGSIEDVEVKAGKTRSLGDRLVLANAIHHLLGRLLIGVARVGVRSLGQHAAAIGRGVEDRHAARGRAAQHLHLALAARAVTTGNVLDKVDDSEYGKFGWVIDPEGNKVELWQPPAGQ